MFEREQRNHVSLLLERVGGWLVVLLSFAGSMVLRQQSAAPFYTKEYWLEAVERLRRGANGYALLAPPLVLAAGAVLLAVAVFRWRRTVFYLQNDALIVERRTILKKSSRLPLDVIATVNLEESFLERLLGTAKIRLDIDSSATAQKTDFTFVLKAPTARAFRQALLEKKEQASAMPERVREPRRVLTAGTPRQALRHMLLCQPVAALAVSALALWLTDYANAGRDLRRFWPVLLLAALGWLLRSVLQLFALWDFRLETDEKRFYLTAGLIKKTSYSFDSERIKAVTVRQPLLGRPFGLAYAEVSVVGMGDDEKETPQICLLMQKQAVYALLQCCAPAFCGKEGARVHGCETAAALLAALVPAVLGGALLALRLHLSWGLAFAALVLLGSLAGARTRRFCADENGLSMTRGMWNKSTVMLLFRDIQTAQCRSNLLWKRCGVGRIRVSVLARQGLRVHTSGYLKRACFEQVERGILP